MNDCPKCGLLGGALFTHVCIGLQPRGFSTPLKSKPNPPVRFEFGKDLKLTIREEDGEYVITVNGSENSTKLREENEKLRGALTLIFLDPLTSHAGRAVARDALGIPFIPFASPERMLKEMMLPKTEPNVNPDHGPCDCYIRLSEEGVKWVRSTCPVHREYE